MVAYHSTDICDVFLSISTNKHSEFSL